MTRHNHPLILLDFVGCDYVRYDDVNCEIGVMEWNMPLIEREVIIHDIVECSCI